MWRWLVPLLGLTACASVWSPQRMRTWCAAQPIRLWADTGATTRAQIIADGKAHEVTVTFPHDSVRCQMPVYHFP